MRIIFWLVLAFLLAATVHIAFVLFVPSREFSRSMDMALQAAGTNTFTIPDQNLQTALLPFTTHGDLVGLCKYDVSKGPVNVAMNVPRGYWTFAVYTIRGRQVYALNDLQADGQSFTVNLSRQPNIISQLLSSNQDDNAATNDVGWSVELADAQGLAVFWMPLQDPLQRKEAMSILSKSRCQPAG